MKLIEILLGGKEDLNYTTLVDKVKQETGGEVIGYGDYGVVIEKNKNTVIKVTTDSIELEHAEKLKNKPVKYFAKIYKVITYGPALGVIEMENLEELEGEIPPPSFKVNLELEAIKYGIDPEELDYRMSNIMKTLDGRFKMVDV
jgi:hypothetical protein